MSELDQLRAEVRRLRDILEIQRVISGASLYSDLGDHARSEAMYTADATLDYSDIFGPEAAALPAAVHWSNARELVRGFDSMHHQTTNFDIDVKGDTATATSLIRSTLRINDETASNGGSYVHRLVRTADGWRIARQEFKLSYSEGPNLIERARRHGPPKTAGG
jgi:ketosteroid isomerase-like protein